MKTLIVYYSRTGINEKLAEVLKQKINGDLEKIVSKVNFSGPVGYLRGGRDAMKKKVCEIESLKFNPKDYDLTIILAPLWGGLVPPPTRAYLAQNKANFKDVAFVSVSGGGECNFNRKAIPDFEEQIGKKPVFAVLLKQEEIKNNSHMEKLKELINH
jgi:flavodoxin